MLKWDNFIHILGVIFQSTPSVQTTEIDFYNYAPIINCTWPAPIFNINACIVSHGNCRVLLRHGHNCYQSALERFNSRWSVVLVHSSRIRSRHIACTVVHQVSRSKRKQSAKQPVPNLHATSAQKYRLKLASNLSKPAQHSALEEYWQHINTAMISAAKFTHPTSHVQSNKHWISSRSEKLIESRKAIPVTHGYDTKRRALKRQIHTRLRKNREHRWTVKAQTMENAFASGNSRALIPAHSFYRAKKTGSQREDN